MRIEDLLEFIQKRMRMSHIYQPVMLRQILVAGGQTSIEEIARALLQHDRSQVDYYQLRTKNMVGSVLTKNGIVDPIKTANRIVGYRLNLEQKITPQDRQRLIEACDLRIAEFVGKRGDAAWAHRSKAQGHVPGSTRYEVLKRAKRRCELCGATEEQTALHVDHILPRNQGGIDDLSNFQALCVTCNTSKRDRDDTDFRDIANSYFKREAGCLFCEIPSARVINESELCYAIRDAYPVTEHHTLIIPKRHVADYFELYQPELNAIRQMQLELRAEIFRIDARVTGFNIGVNAGASAGQTIFHCHVHLIPRRDNDSADPRGGVRGVIPNKQSY